MYMLTHVHVYCSNSYKYMYMYNAGGFISVEDILAQPDAVKSGVYGLLYLATQCTCTCI